MKVFISIDMEGVTGVCAEQQTSLTGAGYAEACTAMRADLDAALEGCLAAGATTVVVCDAHDESTNLSSEGLPEGVTLVSGSPSPLSMMTGLDASFDAVLLVGYHAMSGTAGAVLEHTYAYKVISVSCADRALGEVGLNSALAGFFGVPVVFVSGDDKLAAEAWTLLPGVEAAVVKEGVARTCARHVSPDVARARIRDGAERALRAVKRPDLLRLPAAPLRVMFARAHFCDLAATAAGVRRCDGLTIEISGEDYRQVFERFLVCLSLAASAGAPPSE